MSNNITEAIDNLTLAVQGLQTTNAPVDYTTLLQDILATHQTGYRAIMDAITNRPRCPQAAEPLAIYDCSTGTVVAWINTETGEVTSTPPPTHWRWPPSVPGANATAPENRPPTDGIIIYDEGIDPPITFTETDPPYGDDPGSGFDDNPVTRDFDGERCEKANVFVKMTYDMLLDMSVLTSAAGSVTMSALLAAPSLAKWLSSGFYYTSKTLGAVEYFVSAKLVGMLFDILVGAVNTFGPGVVDFTTGWTTEVVEDLVCAIYNATSERDMKQRWDAVIEQHYDWFAPQAVLIRMFMNSKWTGPLLDNDMVAKSDAPGYNVLCSTACAPTTMTIDAALVRRCASNSSGTNIVRYVIEWPEEFGYTDSSFSGSSYHMAWHHPDPGACPNPYNSGANFRGSSKRTEAAASRWEKWALVSLGSNITWEWYSSTWGWDSVILTASDIGVWRDVTETRMVAGCLQSDSPFQIILSEEPL